MQLLLLLTVAISGISGWNLSLSPSEERLQNRRSGDNFLVVCKVKEYDGAASDVRIEWFKDDKLIPRFGSTMTIERTYSNQLMINRPKISDNGRYTCKAEIQDEKQEVSAEISFIDPPKFINPQPEQHPEEGTTAEIECQVEGTNQLEVFWQFNGVTLDESSQRGYTFSPNKQVLTIPNYSAKRDDGIYNCNAAQYSSFETLTINVTGHARPVITVFDVPAGHRAFEGQTIDLKCGAVGKPKPTYKWFFEKEEIQIARTAKHNVDEGLLIIESLNSEDAGKYSCVANNSVGTSEKEFNLEITLKPKIDIKNEYVVKEGDDVEVVCNYDVESGFSAKFVSGSNEYSVKSESEEEIETTDSETTSEATTDTSSETETVTEAENEDKETSEESTEVELSTTAQTEEESEMKKWKRFAQDVDSGRVSVRSEANKLILTIKNVMLEDAGEYSCSVTNEAGTTSKVSRVGIIHPPILRHYTGASIRSFEGNTVSIYCDVSAVPSPKWHWLKDQEEVEANGVSIQIDTQASSTKLTLQHLEGSDNFGKYTCKADNGVGTLERDIDVVRVVKPAVPSDLDCKKMIYPNFGKCSFAPGAYEDEESRPQSIEFLLAKLEEMESDYNWEHAQHISVKFENDTTIPNLAASTQYVVKARAVNEAGKSDYTEEISLETTDPWAPQSPTSLKMECSDYCILSWDAPNDHGSPLEKYRVEVQEMRRETPSEDSLEVSTLPEQHETEEKESTEEKASVEETTLEYSAEVLPTDPPTSSEDTSSSSEVHNVAFGQPVVLEVSSEEHQLQLTHIRPHSYYKISIAAINAVGQGEPLEIEHQTDESPTKFDTGIDSFYLVIGVVVGVLFVLFLVDLGCFFANRCGLISCICLNICGKNAGGKQRDLESGRNGPESNRLLDSSGAR